MSIGDVIRAANHWQRGRTDWQIFNVPAGADQYVTAVYNGCKRLATRIDGQADGALIESARHRLIADVNAYISSSAPAGQAGGQAAASAPRRGFWHTVGLCIIAVIGGLIVGSIAGRLARSQTGGYLVRSVVRGFIYKGIGALGR